jgi:hypothetical protein
MVIEDEITGDLIQSWKEEALDTWASLYGGLARYYGERDDRRRGGTLREDDDGHGRDAWEAGRRFYREAIALAALDLDVARGLESMGHRLAVETAIRDRSGDFRGIERSLWMADLISDEDFRAKAIAGICIGIETPAVALDLGLMGWALSLPDLPDRRFAIRNLVHVLDDPVLETWVHEMDRVEFVVVRAEKTLDPVLCARALSESRWEESCGFVHRSLTAISRCGSAERNRHAIGTVLDDHEESFQMQAFMLAPLCSGPLGSQARELAMAAVEQIDDDEDSGIPGVLTRTFVHHADVGPARERVLAEIAVATRDLDLIDRFESNHFQELALGVVAIETGDPELCRQICREDVRAYAWSRIAHSRNDLDLAYEAVRQLEGLEHEEYYLDCLTVLIQVARNPPASHRLTPEVRPGEGSRPAGG